MVFSPSVIVCEIFMYELFNVLDSNLWPWKWGQGRTWFGWKLAYKLTLLKCLCLPKLMFLGSAVRSRWHFVTYIPIHSIGASSHNTVELGKNGVDIGLIKISLSLFDTRVLLNQRDATKNCELRGCINCPLYSSTSLDILTIGIIRLSTNTGATVTW